MGVECQIYFKKMKKGFHRTGEAVIGKVRYVVDEPTEYQHVTLSFLGKGKCRWREGSLKNRQTYRGTEDYIIAHVNVFNKRPQDTVTLEGSYEHNFEFFLPEDIPRSYKDTICCISYKIELKFEKPSFFSFNKVFTAEIPVYNYLEPTTEGPIFFGLKKELFAPFASKKPVVSLRAEIDNTSLTPGERAHISYEITNDTDVEISCVKTELHCFTTYISNNKRKKYVQEQVRSCIAVTPSISERRVSPFVCVLPTLPDLYSIQNSNIISVEYKVRATVKLPMPHTNATVDMPILIGHFKEATDLPVEVLEEEDQPPSYWKAMNKGKKKGDKSDDDSD